MATVVHGSLISEVVVKCELCHCRATLPEADKSGWDWFTGKLRATVHYCPTHRGSDEAKVARERAEGIKP